MNIKKIPSLFIFFGFAGVMALSFNNCGEAQFSADASEKASEELASSMSGPEAESSTDPIVDESIDPIVDSESTDPIVDDESADLIVDEETYDASDEEIQAVIDRVSEEELSEPIPVTELLNDPSLYDTYSCSDGKSVLICHFPNNVESQGSKCIGRNAVTTHFSHLREYDLGDGLKTVSDYLGHCRFPL